MKSKSILTWYRRYWYDADLIFAFAALLAALLVPMETLRRILLLNFAALLFHQFEEFGFPGGAPALSNYSNRKTPSAHPDRFPLNQNNAMVVNVVVGGLFYLLPVFFPNVIWLGLAPTLFGFGQLLMHGITFNRILGSKYNSGLAAVVLGHLPLGIWYLVTLWGLGEVTLLNIVLALVYIAFIGGVCMQGIGFKLLASPNSPYPFTEEEMNRAGVRQRLLNRQKGNRNG